MIKHIVMWRLHEQAHGQGRAENAQKAKVLLEGLAGKIPGLLLIEVGFNFCREEAASDIVLYSEFESRAALDAYQTHPQHEAIKPFIMGMRSERRLVDYEVV